MSVVKQFNTPLLEATVDRQGNTMVPKNASQILCESFASENSNMEVDQKTGKCHLLLRGTLGEQLRAVIMPAATRVGGSWQLRPYADTNRMKLTKLPKEFHSMRIKLFKLQDQGFQLEIIGSAAATEKTPRVQPAAGNKRKQPTTTPAGPLTASPQDVAFERSVRPRRQSAETSAPPPVDNGRKRKSTDQEVDCSALLMLAESCSLMPVAVCPPGAKGSPQAKKIKRQPLMELSINQEMAFIGRSREGKRAVKPTEKAKSGSTAMSSSAAGDSFLLLLQHIAMDQVETTPQEGAQLLQTCSIQAHIELECRC